MEWLIRGGGQNRVSERGAPRGPGASVLIQQMAAVRYKRRIAYTRFHGGLFTDKIIRYS